MLMKAVGNYLHCMDVNPGCDNKRALSTYITENDNTQSIDLAMEICEYFEISLKNIKDTITDMKKEVSNWSSIAKNHGLTKREIEKWNKLSKLINVRSYALSISW